MDMSISEILKELETLPRGYISHKIIKGKEYFYLQWLENGKIQSRYIPRNEVNALEMELNRRKELEKILKETNELFPSHPRVISAREKELTGYLMSEDTVVATYKKGSLTYINDKLAPTYIVKTHNLDEFLKSRCIDLSRPNARALLKLLGIQDKNELFISLFSRGVCITDNYWFKPLGSKLNYKSVCFDNDLYSELSLNGRIPQLRTLGSPTPELTNIGSFEKAWKLINGEWWLYKKGNEDQIFSELFVYHFSTLMNVPSARYEYIDGDIRSKNFADKYNFESMFQFLGTNENYEDVFNVLLKISKEIAKQFVKLIWIDTIVYNVDRHNQNYGVLRDKETRQYISLAPNFDNNMALLSFNQELTNNSNKDSLMKFFVDLINKNDKAKKLFNEFKNTPLHIDRLNDIFDLIPIKRDRNKISKFIICRYQYLVNL